MLYGWFIAPWIVAGLVARDSYPKRELLMEVAALRSTEGAASPRIVDARPVEPYRAGHIPGAVSVDLSDWSRHFASSQDTESWAKRLGDLGIDVDTHVVIYDDGSVKDAARVWWILRYWGVKDVRLLNGGWKAWNAADAPTSVDAAQPPKTSPRLTPQSARLAKKEQMLAAVKESAQIVDSRSKAEYCGEQATAKRNGSVPGAIHRDWADLVDKDTGRFKSAAELTAIFNQSGIDLNRPTVTFCQSGGRASVMAFAMELMGAKDVRNYYRSWSEWGNADDTPIVKPPGK
jgi:thiosulfate/3-mercaptopyruvate sulfurtransferase